MKLKNNTISRTTLVAGAMVLMALSTQASAEQMQKLSGLPLVQDCGTIVLQGKRVVLWGIDTLAPDQRCWQGQTAWACGEEATSALRHYIEGRQVTCEIMDPNSAEPFHAKCTRQRGDSQHDIAKYLVAQGWALDRGETSGGAYFQAEQEAQTNKRGVWTSRFQTAEDWKNGIQRFVGEDDESDEDGE